MSKVTTAYCKSFLVQFELSNKLEYVRWGVTAETVDPDTKAMIDGVFDCKNWKRLYKRKPDKNECYMTYVDGAPLNRHAEPQQSVKFSDIVSERGFEMVLSDGQIAYIVLEMKDGSLRLSNYIGD